MSTSKLDLFDAYLSLNPKKHAAILLVRISRETVFYALRSIMQIFFSESHTYCKWNIGGRQIFTKREKVQTAETKQETESTTKEISVGNYCPHAAWLCGVLA